MSEVVHAPSDFGDVVKAMLHGSSLIAWLLFAVCLCVWGINRLRQDDPSPEVAVPISIDDAIRYIGRQSALATSQDWQPGRLEITVAEQLRDALKTGDLKARGRRYHKLYGGMNVRSPRDKIDPKFWENALINAWWALHRPRPGNFVETTETAETYEGMHDIQLDRRRLEQLWPRPSWLRRVLRRC